MLQVMWQVNDNLWNSFCWKLILKFIIIYYSFLLIYNNYRLTLMYSSVNASLRQPHSFPPSLRHTTIRGYAPTVKAECVVVVGVDLYRYCPTKTTSNRFACYFRCPFLLSNSFSFAYFKIKAIDYRSLIFIYFVSMYIVSFVVHNKWNKMKWSK